MASEVHHLKIHVLTPLHIGGPQEKHLKEGLDYLQEADKIWLFDQARMINIFGLNTYCAAIEKGKSGIVDLLKGRKMPLDQISAGYLTLAGKAEDYHTQVKEAAYGKPILPGSSLKGSARSVIFKRLFRESGASAGPILVRRKENKFSPPPEDEFLGKFDRGLMRFIQCPDTFFEKISLYNTKIFNLSGKGDALFGGWKHELKGGTNATFKPEGFTTAYECIAPGSTGAIRLGFDRLMYERCTREGMLPNGAKRLYTKSFLEVLLKDIYNHTAEYLKKEIAFFRKYTLPETDLILESLENIQRKNTPETPVLRLAHGSGFHSITGDWQYDDYCDDQDINENTRKKKYKSRRLAFERAADGQYRFLPMGFIQLMTEDYYNTRFKAAAQAEEAIRLAEQQAAERAEQERLEEEKRREAAARQPVMVSAAQLNFKKQPLVDGVVTGQKGAYLVCRPYVEEFKDTFIEIRYSAGLPEGTVIQFPVTLQKDKLVPAGPPKIKSGNK